ncbi:expressed unknown protein [Seminavis robusta]|uniref:Transmembrane protein n=1 Tax=Seminavis robusta TaxID=568900 RepID=A0A9N8DQA8_9STRA|nr:expressed unknown protein [Seminavis robusta]|eukprot:Sro295_g110460.1 n/a (887) ;mRNA; r:39508-42805
MTKEDNNKDEPAVAASVSLDEGLLSSTRSSNNPPHAQEEEEGDNHQTTGQETTSGEPASQRHHKKAQSWSDVLEGVANDLLGNDNNDNNQRPPLPPPPPAAKPSPQRRNSADKSYALRNQTFLKQAAAGALNTSTNKQQPHYYHVSPSPNTTFRKRLHLTAIDESDDGQSFVVVDQQQKQSMRSSWGSTPSDVPSPPPQQQYPNWFGPNNNSNNATIDDDSSIQSKTIRFETAADDSSVLSSLAGDYYAPPTAAAGGGGYYGSSAANDNTYSGALQTSTSSIMRNTATTNSNQEYYDERVARFEQQQEEQFQQKKIDMEQRLGHVLEQNSITKESDKNAIIDSYMQELEKERVAMMELWKAEMRREEERMRQEQQRLFHDFGCYEAIIRPCIDSLLSMLATFEVVLSNMPLTVGAVGLSWVTQGTVWFKFTEEVVSTCVHAHYFSDQCSFLEFPGCFACDVTNPYYQAALYFHLFCSSVSALCCLLFLAKVILAPNVVLDMLKNPTTSTPVGVWCIAVVCTFAGQYGIVGEAIVLVTSFFHVMLAFWFLYTTIFKFRGLPDPGWFPNVVGISYAAVKTFIYLPTPGLIIMMCCTLFFLCTFFVSVVRVYFNHKIAAPVCWIQLSAPSITLYALTLLSQPTPSQETLMETSPDAKLHFTEMLEDYFMPSQHFFMALTMVGLVSAVHSLYAYRASLISLSPNMPPGSPFKKLLFGYWCFFLVVGTVLNIVFTIKYIVRIPEWTKPDLTGEEEPPAPVDTIVHEMLDETGAHETMRQPFVSPAVLEAAEAGVLVRVKRGTEDYRRHGPFRRTRNVTSLGFDLMLSELELREERARLLDWVAKNAPRKRNRTMSVPWVSREVYGTFSNPSEGERLVRGHTRANTTTGAFM